MELNIQDMQGKYPTYKHSAFSGLIGVAQVDVTPPAGIYSRNWGAGKYDTAEGVHRPLMLTCFTFQSEKKETPLVLISADFGVWGRAEDGAALRNEILAALSLSPSQLMFCLSHTHSGPTLNRDDANRQGGEYIDSYIRDLQRSAIAAAQDALFSAVPATLTWHYGSCKLATDRDLPDPVNHRFVVGFNPANSADDTLLVGRITDEQDRIRGVLVNYACHPTTLGWGNRLISPDFVGSMRELVQAETHAPCLFLQGASGELAPAEQYVAAVEKADKNGRVVGYSVMATLESMLAPKTELSFSRIVESGAPLAVWEPTPFQPSGEVSAERVDVAFRLKSLPSLAEIERLYRTAEDRVLKERLWRQRCIRKNLGDGDTVQVPLWAWKLGDSFLVGQPNEAWSDFQKELRRLFSPAAVAVMNLTNGSAGYLPPAEWYDKDIYQVWQSPFAAGSLEKLIQTAIHTLRK